LIMLWLSASIWNSSWPPPSIQLPPVLR
jgi:hypothetical protein